MPSKRGAALLACLRSVGRRVFGALAITGGLMATAHAGERPPAAVLFDRLCANSLRANEEDRLYGLISLTVRTTIKYEGGIFSPDLIDDAVQDGLGATLDACPTIGKTEDDQRLGMVVALIRDATIKRMQDDKAGYSVKQTERASAADLSEELSDPEIDAWLDALPARQRALALFLYASNVTREQIASAVGLPPDGLAAAFNGVKADLMKFFRADWNAPIPPPVPASAAIEYREAGQDLTTLLAPPAGAAPAGGTTAPDAKPAAETRALSAAKPAPAATAMAVPSVRISGISTDVYAGWSLLASVTGLPADRGLDLPAPILLIPDQPDHRRMLAVGLNEISDPHDATRQFLVKAYAIDGDKEGSGIADTFHFGGPLDNAAARQTLHNRTLAAIEIARCLWHDFDTAPDPALCR